jgi:tripartite-type tricarboxylate transporter receptor subunit TctC
MRDRTIVAALSFVAAIATWSGALAEAFPVRPVKLITAGAPGSIPDTLARPLADELAHRLGQPVVVENRPGAGGIVAIHLLAQARPDGYTIGLVSRSQMVYNVYLFQKLPYDPLRDFTPVINLVAGPGVVAVHPSFPAATLQDLVTLAKAQPGKIHYAIPQMGAPPHIFALRLSDATQIEMVAVPFRGAPEALSAVIAGEVPVLFDAPLIVVPHAKAGKLRVIAVTGSERSRLLPETPTVAESGYPSLEGEAWLGLVVPAGVPDAIVARINEVASRALRATALKEHLESLGWRILGESSAEFAATITKDHASWGAIIKKSGIRLGP